MQNNNNNKVGNYATVSDAMCSIVAPKKDESIGAAARLRHSPTKIRHHVPVPYRCLPPDPQTPSHSPSSSPLRASSTATHYDTKYYDELVASVMRGKQTASMKGEYEYEVSSEEEERDVRPPNRTAYLAKPLYVYTREQQSSEHNLARLEERVKRMRVIRFLNRSKVGTELFPLYEVAPWAPPYPTAAAAATTAAAAAATATPVYSSSKSKDKASKTVVRSIPL